MRNAPCRRDSSCRKSARSPSARPRARQSRAVRAGCPPGCGPSPAGARGSPNPGPFVQKWYPSLSSYGINPRFQPPVNGPHPPVELQKLAELFIVHPAVLFLRLIGLGDLDDLRDLLHADFAQRAESRQGRAHRVGAARIGDAPHRAAQDVRLDLAPDLGSRAAADEIELRERAADKFLDVAREPAQVERHALHHRAHTGGARGAGRLVEESAAGVVSLTGRQPPINPRCEDQALAPGLDLRGLRIQYSVKIALRGLLPVYRKQDVVL